MPTPEVRGSHLVSARLAQNLDRSSTKKIKKINITRYCNTQWKARKKQAEQSQAELCSGKVPIVTIQP